MGRLLFFLCAFLLAATPAQGGNGIDPERRPQGLTVPTPDGGRPGRLVRPRPELPGNASAGASSAPERRGGTDLGYEAEKEEEEFLRKRRTGRSALKGR